MIPGFEQAARPLVAGVNNTVYPPQKTFFFERADGTIFAVEENEAWRIVSNKNQMLGQRINPPKLIGTSNGEVYAKGIAEAKTIFKEQGLEASQARIRQAFDEELVIARGHAQMPRNFDITDGGGNPTNLGTISL